MVTFNFKTAENYGNNAGGSFFMLREDKDTARVRFLYDSIDDIVGHVVHEVEVEGKKRYVACLRQYNEPLHSCPLCKAGGKITAKLFLQLYDVDTKELKIWDRGKSFFSKLGSLCIRYNPLVNTVFEIERNGKRGDTNTKYEIYPINTDKDAPEGLPGRQDIINVLVQERTFEELEFYVTHGFFKEITAERNPLTDSRTETRRPAAPTRRTPVDTF